MADKRKASPEPQPAGALIKRQKNDDALVLKASTSSGAGGGALIRAVERTSGLQAPIMSLTGHGGEIFSSKFDPSGQHLASASFDRSIFLWNTYSDCINYNVLNGHTGAVLEVQWSRDGNQLFTASTDKTLGLWDANTGERTKRMKGHTSIVNSVSPSRRGTELLASVSDDSTVKIWDTRQKHAAETFTEKFPLCAVCWSEDGGIVFAGGIDNEIKAWDLRKKEVVFTLSGHMDTITGLRLSPDGSSLLSNAMDNTVRTWDVKPFAPTGSRLLKIFEGAPHGYEKNLLRPSWSPDGDFIAVGSGDRTVVIWDTATRKIAYKLPGHKGCVNEVDWHPREPIDVRNVYVNDQPAKFQHVDPLCPLFPPSAKRNVHHHNQVRTQYSNSLLEADEGELSVDIPEQVQITKIVDVSSQAAVKDEGSAVPTANDAATSNIPTMYSPIVIRIEYSLRNPRAGVHFVLPDPHVVSNRYPHLYTQNHPGSARLWMPCVDAYQERCVWELQCTVPRTVKDALQASGDLLRFPEEEFDELPEMIVVASGELLEQFVPANAPNKKTFHYKLQTAACASSILLAVGPFEVVPIPGWERLISMKSHDVPVPDEDHLDAPHSSPTELSQDYGAGGYAFCLPGWEDDMQYTISFLGQSLDILEQYVGASYPFASFKLVFVEDAYNPVITGASIAIASSNLLVRPDVIDQTFETRRLLCRAVAAQWIGHYIVAKSWAEIWLIVGLANHLTWQFIKKHFGNNESRFRMKQDMNRICTLDINQPPLFPVMTSKSAIPSLPLAPGTTVSYSIDPMLLQHFDPEDQWSSMRSEFISLKAPVVLYMLDKRIGRGNLQKVINKIMVSAMSGELPNGLSTHHFFKIAKKVSGKMELKAFADQWVYGCGVPKFIFNYTFNRKRMMVEFKFRQENVNTTEIGKVTKFMGPFTIRIHEPNGTFDTEVQIDEVEKTFDIPYHTKYKRIRRRAVRRPRKGKQEDPDDFMDDGMGDDADGDDRDVMDGPDTRDDATADWKDDEPDRLSFEWLRLDPDSDWMCIKVFEQADYMWAAQLQKDRDVVAQVEALEALHRLPSVGTSTALVSVINDQTYFYRIRMEACFALAKCGKAQLDWIGLTQLLKIYRDLFCVPTIGLNPSVYLPRCNDFSVLQTYYLQKTLPLAAAKVKNNEGLTPSEVRRFLLQLLKYNNNSGNKYSDNYFASALLQALGEAFLPAPSKSLTDLWKAPDTTAPRDATDSSGGVFVEEFNFDDGHKSEQLFAQTYIGKEEDVQLFHEAVVEVQRYRSLDMLLPSYHNTVTVSCLETLLKWMMAGLIPTDLNLYLAHSRYGHFLQVRLVSIDALFLLNGLTNEDVLRYVLNLVAYDPIPYVRYYVARSLAEVASIAFGTSKTSLPESTGGTKDEAALNKEKMLFEKIRKQISLLQDVKTVLWDLLNSDALEHRVRVNVLKFCEVVFDVDVTAPPQPVVVGLPKLRIKLPPMMMTAGDESSSDEEAPPVPAKRIKLVHDAGASSVPERTQPDTPVKPKLDTARLLSADTPTVASPSPISAISPPIADTEPAVQPLDEEFAAEAQNILTKLINHPSAAPFMLPVDINQAPDYYDTIKEPMDLTTAQKRLRMGAYNNDKNNLIQDVRLIFENCFKYNMEESHVCKQAKRLQEFFENEVLAPPKEDKPEAEADDSAMADIQIETPTQPVAPAIDDVVMSPVEATAGTLDVEPERAEEKPPTPPVPSIPMESIVKVDDAVAPVSEPLLSSSEHRRCKKILRKLNGHGVSYWFKQPVDPVAQNIPDYFTVIKHPMDLYTVKSKLESNQYTSLDAFARDVRLIFQNAITYNQAESQAHIDAKTLLAYFENEWAETVKNREATPAPTATDTSRGSSNEKSPISTATTMSEDDVHRCERLLKQCKNDVDQSHRKTMKKKLREGKYGSFEMFEKELNTVRSASRTEKRLASSEPVQRAKSPAKVEPSPANKREQSVEKRPEKRAKSTSKTPEEASMPKPRQATPKPPERTASPQPVLVKKEVIKEKEISQAAPKGLSSNDRKRCMRVLKRLQGTKSALPFLNPVDPIALNIPNYFDVIKHPMDLSTIQRKLEAGEYATPIDCYGDFRLMLNNCFQFNPKGHPVVQEGEVLGQLLEKEWEAAGLPPSSADDTKTQQRSKSKSITPPAADEGATPSSLRRSATPSSSVDRTTSITIQTMLTKLKSHHHAHFFLAPVDGSIYPDYYVKIKNPIDLSTMQSKLDVGAYKTVDEFESDVKQLFANCYTYNAKKTLAYVNGQSLERFFRKEWKTILQTPPKARVREFLNDSPYKDGRMSEMAICKEIHMLLVAHSMSFPFLNPVPRTVPNYHNIIKKPMDFGTIGKRLERGVYKGRDDFRNDYILVFNNARIFNPQGSDIYGMADILEREFESHWKRLFKTEGKPRQSTPPESRPRQSTPPSSSSSKPEKERRKEKESAVPDAKKGKSGKPGDDDGSKGEKPKPKPTISLKLSIKGLKK